MCVRRYSIKMEYHFIKGRCRRREKKKKEYDREREKFVWNRYKCHSFIVRRRRRRGVGFPSFSSFEK
jgi:hypothetical protein